MEGICKDCKKRKVLTKHSEIGSHKPPYILLCRPCHDARHKTIQKRFKRTQSGSLGKYAKGTKRQHRK